MGTYVQVGGETTTPGNPKHQMLNSGQKKTGTSYIIVRVKNNSIPASKTLWWMDEVFWGEFCWAIEQEMMWNVESPMNGILQIS